MSNKVFFLFMRGMGYFFKEFKTNLLSLITIITLILIFHTSITVSSSVRAFLSNISATNSLRVYLDIDLKYELDELKSKILKVSQVEDVILYEPKDAKKYLLENAPDIKSINSFDEEFFPTFFLVTLNDNSTLEDVILVDEKIKKMPNVDQVSYGKEYLNRFTQINVFVTLFIIIFTLFLIIAISFVVYNTIRLSLYKYSEEIKIYNLVGATRPFIIIPYLISSSLQTILGYILGTLMFWGAFNIINSMMLSLSLSVFKPLTAISYILSFILLLIIALISSSISVISYLKKVSVINEN